METAAEFLIRKGFKKVYQIDRRYNLTIGEMLDFLNEYANHAFKDFIALSIEKGKKPPKLKQSDK